MQASYETELNKLCDDNTDPTDVLISALQEAYPAEADLSFCTVECPCQADPADFDSLVYVARVAYMDPNNEDYASTILECPESLYLDGFEPEPAALAFLAFLEQEFQCSGLCSVELFYYFSDVANGIPEASCQDEIIDFIDRNEFFWLIFGF